jgi:hypothetical protein
MGGLRRNRMKTLVLSNLDPPATVIISGCARGADTHGKSAGPILGIP